MCLNWFKNRDIPDPDIIGTINYNDLRMILKQAMGDIPIYLPDNTYKIATKASFYQFLINDKTDKYLYTGDPGYDCDDYANCLHGNASIPKWATVPIGTVWLSTPAHAVNFFVDENFIIWYVEPQNDKMYKVIEKTDWVPAVAWL